jgi:IS4 transposase
VLDRGYVDYARLHKIHQASAFFVIRAKKNLLFRRLYSRKVDKTTGLRCDQTIKLIGPKTSKHYPGKLRRVKFLDAARGKTYVYLTNHMEIDSMQVVSLYISRWKVELFFKWIKQHLRVKVFWGESENAVQTQIWVAICSYLLIVLLREKLNIKHLMYELLQILSVSAFDKVTVNQLFSNTPEVNPAGGDHNQLTIF